MGTHALKANVSADALEAGFSNEGGFAGGISYRRTKERIESLNGKKYPCIHLVGGGVKSPILCQMAAR